MTTTKQPDSGASKVVPAVGEKRLVVVGATGMVGGYALRFALDNSAVKSVTSIGRKKVGITHPKLKEVLHQNFEDCFPLADVLLAQDAVVYCLGTYTGSVSDAQLRVITAEYTIEFARVFRSSSPNATFSFLSGSGADPIGRSRLAFARYKGQAEKALIAARFPRVYLSRPAYIYPLEPRERTASQLPPNACGLPCVSSSFFEPSDSGGRLGPSNSARSNQRNGQAPKPGFKNRGIRAMGDGQTGNSADCLPDQGHYSLISAAARRRIIATQKTRWAEWRTQHKKK
jgi:hypothetical protein